MINVKTNLPGRGTFGIVLVLFGALVLSACGARDEADSALTGQPYYNSNGELVTTPYTSGSATTTGALGVRVISDVNSISTGGTDAANIKALITDQNNNAVAGQSVIFSSTGGVLQNISPVTDENGEATATLKLPQDFQNQEIVVTVLADTYTADVKVAASGSRLEVTGPSSLVAGDQAELVVRLIAGNDEPIANQIVTISSTAGNVVTPTELVTDPDGQVTAFVGSQAADDTILVSALNGTVSATHSFEVSADQLQFDSGVEGAEYTVGQNSNVTVTWTSQGVPVINRNLRFSITAGTINSASTVTTDAAGRATITIRSNSAGPAKLTVEAADTGKPKKNVDFEFVATNPQHVEIDASSSQVNVNETSTITALVTDSLGNPVKNQEVDFNSIDLKGGQLNPASAISNSAGIASVTFTAGNNATQLDAIVLEATLKGSAISDTMRLTVSKRALNVTLGTSNKVIIKPLSTQFAMPFLVQVADGSGTPLENATVKLSVRPVEYRKGRLYLVDKSGQVNDGSGDFVPWEWMLRSFSSTHSFYPGYITCPTEDVNGNRFLDTVGISEDTNNNGSLDPQDPASLAAVEDAETYATLSGGVLVTDKNGSGFFELIYPASNSWWSTVEITARAEALGSEAQDEFRTVLHLPTSEITTTDQVPSNYISPYGDVYGSEDADPLNAVTIDDRSWTIYRGCTIPY